MSGRQGQWKRIRSMNWHRRLADPILTTMPPRIAAITGIIMVIHRRRR
jgi:hypothetical protein